MHIALIYSKYEDLDESITKANPNGPTHMRDTVLSVKEALESGGHEVSTIEADNHLLSTLEEMPTPDLLFNLSSGIAGKRSQANITGMLEMTGLPLLGSGLAAQVLGLHKEITKSLLLAHGIRTVRYQMITDEHETIREDLVYPLIVKPEHEGSGIGVTESSKVDSPEQLGRIIKEKIALHNQALLIEEYLPGREFTVGVMGNAELEILPIKEAIFAEDGPQMLTNEIKLGARDTNGIPANISQELKDEIKTMAAKTYRILRCQDFARVDIRLDKEGRPNVIELNTSPGLGKDFSYFPILAEAAGYSYEDLLNRLVTIAMEPKSLQ